MARRFSFSVNFKPFNRQQRIQLWKSVSAPGQAWHFLQGGSPCRVRPNQPPVSSVAGIEEGVNDNRTRYPKRTQRILWAAGEAALSKAIQPRYFKKQSATVLMFRKPTRRDRYGEILEGLPGSKSVARRERDARNLGGPMVSLREGKVDQLITEAT